jgi:hypothetical protein
MGIACGHFHHCSRQKRARPKAAQVDGKSWRSVSKQFTVGKVTLKVRGFRAIALGVPRQGTVLQFQGIEIAMADASLTVLNEGQVSAALAVLVPAFLGDPIFNHYFPDTNTRRKVFELFFNDVIRGQVPAKSAFAVMNGKRSLQSRFGCLPTQVNPRRLIRSGASVLSKSCELSIREERKQSWQASKGCRRPKLTAPRTRAAIIDAFPRASGSGGNTMLSGDTLSRLSRFLRRPRL